MASLPSLPPSCSTCLSKPPTSLAAIESPTAAQLPSPATVEPPTVTDLLSPQPSLAMASANADLVEPGATLFGDSVSFGGRWSDSGRSPRPARTGTLRAPRRPQPLSAPRAPPLRGPPTPVCHTYRPFGIASDRPFGSAIKSKHPTSDGYQTISHAGRARARAGQSDQRALSRD